MIKRQLYMHNVHIFLEPIDIKSMMIYHSVDYRWLNQHILNGKNNTK